MPVEVLGTRILLVSLGMGLFAIVRVEEMRMARGGLRLRC